MLMLMLNALGQGGPGRARHPPYPDQSLSPYPREKTQSHPAGKGKESSIRRTEIG